MRAEAIHVENLLATSPTLRVVVIEHSGAA